jgi:aldehyde:ferredoxin oxidoreductase
MVNPHGADHCCNIHDTMFVAAKQLRKVRALGIVEPVPLEDIGPRKAALFRLEQLRNVTFDSLLLCIFLPYSYEQIARATAAVTGWDTGVMEQIRISERILTEARLFNIREGFTAADDTLPKRFYQPKTGGALSNKPLDQEKTEQAKSYYYTLMGWDPESGIPTEQRLEELDIT